MNKKLIQVTKTVWLEVWYSRAETSWVGQYVSFMGHQLAPAWYENTRDGILLFRPDVPKEN
jgi:hypothetical protein